MCEPLTILSLASTAAGLAGTAANYAGQNKALKQQEQEYNNWVKYQQQIRNQENVRQEDMRAKADVARQEGLTAISADEQARRQAEEEARLTPYLQGDGQVANREPDAPTNVNDRTLSGASGGSPVFQEDLAKRIAGATAAARQRIAAMARVSSYGESFGGLGTENPILQQRAGAGIDRQNEGRRGSLAAYGTEGKVDPVQIKYNPSAFAQFAPTLLSLGTQGLGNSLAGTLGKAAAPTVVGGATPALSTNTGWASPVQRF